MAVPFPHRSTVHSIGILTFDQKTMKKLGAVMYHFQNGIFIVTRDFYNSYTFLSFCFKFYVELLD